MTDWSWIEFGELYKSPSKNGLMAPSKVRGSGVLLVNMKEIFTFDRISNQRMERAPLPERNHESWLLRAGDLLFARQSLTLAGAGKVSLVVAAPEPMTFESHIIRVRLDESRADAQFYYYLFRSPFGRTLVESIVEQVAAAGIRSSDLARLKVPAPSVEDQRRIASVLGAFDDLIETNRRTAAAALELSRVSFSKMAAHSENFVELRDVTKKIGSGATPRGGKEVYQDQGISLIRSQNIYDGHFSFDGLARISDAAADALSGVTVCSGDVLVNITGESVTRTTLVPDRALPARVSQHVAIVRPDPEVLDPGFLMLAMLSSPIKAHLNGLSTAGATRRALTKAHLSETRIPLPPLIEQRRASRMLRIIAELSAEIADLTRARDELLPLLISGRVRVSEGVV